MTEFDAETLHACPAWYNSPAVLWKAWTYQVGVECQARTCLLTFEGSFEALRVLRWGANCAVKRGEFYGG